MKRCKHLLLLCFITLTLVACSTTSTGRRQLTLVSEKRAISSSAQVYNSEMTSLYQEGKLVRDPALLNRIDTITGRLIAQAIERRPDSADWNWSVEIIDDPQTVNAWCMAGGRMAIYTGLLIRIQPTDDELAQVMGHEITHALENHTAERMSVAMASAAGVIAVGFMSNRPLAAMGATAAAASLAIKLPNSRKSEAEADVVGMELAAKAGYDPQAAVTLWRKMAAVAGDGPPQFLSSHPAPGNREESLRALIPEMMPYYEANIERPVYKLVRSSYSPPPDKKKKNGS
ncbi:MAG: M48 family metallopeptidase [Gammaproteobacteria bacterium]